MKHQSTVEDASKDLLKQQEKERKLRKTAIECILQNPKCIPIIKHKLIDDDLLEVIIDTDPSIFCDIVKYIKVLSLRIINVGLEKDGGNLKRLSQETIQKLPFESFLIAVENNPKEALPFIPSDLLTEAIKAEIFQRDPDIIHDNNITINETYLTSNIEQYPSNIKYVVNPSETLKCLAIKEDPHVALYFRELTEKMMDTIELYHPTYVDKLPNYTRPKYVEGSADNGTTILD